MNGVMKVSWLEDPPVTRGLYYKKFYGRNNFGAVVGKSVGYTQSLPV